MSKNLSIIYHYYTSKKSWYLHDEPTSVERAGNGRGIEPRFHRNMWDCFHLQF